MSPSLQASTSDLSLSAVPAEEAAEAEPEVGAPPPGPVAPPPVAPPAPPPGGSERIRVRAAAASSRAHETDEVRRFRTCVPRDTVIKYCHKVEELVTIAEMKFNQSCHRLSIRVDDTTSKW